MMLGVDVARMAAMLALTFALGCDSGEGQPRPRIYVADASSSQASVSLGRAHEGFELHATRFSLAYIAEGQRPLCGCVEVDAGHLRGAPRGLLEDAAELGVPAVAPGSDAQAHICAKQFEPLGDDAGYRAAAELWLDDKRVPVELIVELGADEGADQGSGDAQLVHAKVPVPLAALGVPGELIDSEMLDAALELDFSGKARATGAVLSKFAGKICVDYK